MGNAMIIRGIKLRVTTAKGDFGFLFSFARNLTIIRAGNSSGKSTLVNTLLYGLGMEELVGGKGERALPYAVKDYIEHENSKLPIVSSEVLLELENGSSQIITLRRAIRDQERNGKLIEIYPVAHLTKGEELREVTPTYVHDAGGATRQEGFHSFLEKFLGLSLPQVATTSSGECKLYLQTIFAAMAVEQKRGWTDYIANIPFYGIRDARTRVVEFLLGLDVFETNTLRNQLNIQSVEIDREWRTLASNLTRQGQALGLVFEGLPPGPSSQFDSRSVVWKRLASTTELPLADYMVQLRGEYEVLVERAKQVNRIAGAEAVEDIDNTIAAIQEITVIHDRAVSSLGMHRTSLREYEQLLGEAQEDLERNKAAAKLRALGATHDLELASGHCPTCHQAVEDNLLSHAVTGPQMDLETNIGYLDSQVRMLKRQIAGLKENIQESEVRVAELSKRLAAKHDYLTALRGDLSSGASESKAVVRRQIQIEVELSALDEFQRLATKAMPQLDSLASQLAQNQSERKKLPKDAYSQDDEVRIKVFEKLFRANAGSFEYESAPIQDIELSRDNLVPCLSQLELREIRRSDIKADSSASDFVRLIWSYLLALYQASAQPSLKGNHPGVLLFDEPGQHSMAVDSQHALLLQLAGDEDLQSIVAASFDESEAVFQQATVGVTHKLLQWEGKLIQPFV